jgi:hypothetical protein
MIVLLSSIKNSLYFQYFVSYYSQFIFPGVPFRGPTVEAQPMATPAQPREKAETAIPLEVEVVDLTGGGGWTRTNDLRIMRPSL